MRSLVYGHGLDRVVRDAAGELDAIRDLERRRAVTNLGSVRRIDRVAPDYRQW
ncbi:MULTISPECIES: hypothetical protein [Natrialbaceae]|uniref:hypothetical protein n=1 Tax=Natrialbaceae TaxID=1644061 RepID=UPI00207CD708|nr:hypothetical protein [Natronococcus sp. CG52]